MASAMLIDYAVHTSLAAIYFIISVLILFKVYRTMRTNKSVSNLSTSYKISYASVLILGTLWFLAVLLNQLTLTFLNSMSIQYNGYWFCKIMVANHLIIFVGYEASVLNYFATRIKQLFSSNPKMQKYSLPKWMIPMYQVLTCTVAIFVIISSIILSRPYMYNVVKGSIESMDSPSNWTYCSSADALVLIMAIYCIFVYIMNIIIWILFINRFYVIIKDTGNNEDDVFIHVMKKQTLLVGIATTSTVVLWSMSFNIPHTVYLWISDFFITEICVFLSFASFEHYYNMLGCQLCENKCCSCVDNIVSSKLNQVQIQTEITSV